MSIVADVKDEHPKVLIDGFAPPIDVIAGTAKRTVLDLPLDWVKVRLTTGKK